MTDRSATVPVDVRVYDDAAAMIAGAAAMFAYLVHHAIMARGRCTVALSGGSTPRALFALLASDEWRAKIPWPQLHLFWGDERWVPDDHADSNYRMAQEAMLRHVPVPPAQIHGMRGTFDHPSDAAAAYEALLRAELVTGATGVPSFDLLLLGMGADGHTASLFPHSSALQETTRCVVANHVDKLDTDRITITAPVIQAAAATMVLVAGAEKAGILSRVISGPIDVDALPSQILRSSPRGSVHWLLDRQAAALLPDQRAAQ